MSEKIKKRKCPFKSDLGQSQNERHCRKERRLGDPRQIERLFTLLGFSDATQWVGKEGVEVLAASSVLLLWRLVLGRASLGLEHLGRLHLLLGHDLLSGLGGLESFLEFLLSCLQVKSLPLLLGLDDSGHLGGVGLDLLDGIFGQLLLLQLGLFQPLKGVLVLGLERLLSILAALGCFVKLFSLLLSLLDDDIDELGSLLDSDLHPDIKSSSDLGGLLIDKV